MKKKYKQNSLICLMWCGVFIGIIEVVAVGIAAWNDAIATIG